MCPVIPNQRFENELMTETNATKIVSTALIVFHSSGSCELCSKVEWRIEKCVQKAKACFPCLEGLMDIDGILG